MDSQHIAVIIIFDFVVSLPVPDVMADRPFLLVVQSPLCAACLKRNRLARKQVREVCNVHCLVTDPSSPGQGNLLV